jgi:hypothetical protein
MNPNIYHWRKRLKVGARLHLRRGRDYGCPTSSIIQQARNAATGKPVRLEIEDRGESVVINVKRKERRYANA